MSTTIGTVKDQLQPEEIDCEIYINGGIVLFISAEDGTTYKFRMGEAQYQEFMDYLVVAGNHLGYTSDLVK